MSPSMSAFREILKILIEKYLKNGYTCSDDDIVGDLDLMIRGRLLVWFRFYPNIVCLIHHGISPPEAQHSEWDIPDVLNPSFDPEKWFKKEIMHHPKIKKYLKKRCR